MSRKYIVSLATHKGYVREKNEDNFIINDVVKRNIDKPQSMRAMFEEPILVGVFDGMGGENGGAAASEISARVAGEYYAYLRKTGAEPENSIDSYVLNANRLIREFMNYNNLNRGGSTFALACIINGYVYSFSLGDSRIYFYREGIMAQITDDHTLANKKLKANLFTREEAENSPESHVLTKYLGMNCEENELFAERYRPFRLNPGEKLIICSDGLYDMCTNDEICDTLNVRKGGAEELVILALANGGIDNITCLIVEAV